MSDKREILYRVLATHPEEALVGLRALPDGLVGKPPEVLVEKLLATGIEPDSPYYVIAREWERVAMGEALWKGFLQARHPGPRLTAAWLVKCFPAKTLWAEFADHASRQNETTQLRVLLIQALDMLAFARGVSWGDLKSVLERLLEDPVPEIRENAVGAVGSFPRTEETLRLLSARTADLNEVVARTARHVLVEMQPPKRPSS